MTALVDITGQQFGRLKVLRRDGTTQNWKSGYALWRCQCDCGTIVHKTSPQLRNAKTDPACPVCVRGRTHGVATGHRKPESRHPLYPLYRIWVQMRQRCHQPSCRSYSVYGARGISVCASWMIFDEFMAWALKSGYKKGLTIERIDRDKGYYPENCEWVTRAENSRRVSRPKNLEIKRIAEVEQYQKDFILGQLSFAA